MPTISAVDTYSALDTPDTGPGLDQLGAEAKAFLNPSAGRGNSAGAQAGQKNAGKTNAQAGSAGAGATARPSVGASKLDAAAPNRFGPDEMIVNFTSKSYRQRDATAVMGNETLKVSEMKGLDRKTREGLERLSPKQGDLTHKLVQYPVKDLVTGKIKWQVDLVASGVAGGAVKKIDRMPVFISNRKLTLRDFNSNSQTPHSLSQKLSQAREKFTSAANVKPPAPARPVTRAASSAGAKQGTTVKPNSTKPPKQESWFDQSTHAIKQAVKDVAGGTLDTGVEVFGAAVGLPEQIGKEGQKLTQSAAKIAHTLTSGRLAPGAYNLVEQERFQQEIETPTRAARAVDFWQTQTNEIIGSDPTHPLYKLSGTAALALATHRATGAMGNGMPKQRALPPAKDLPFPGQRMLPPARAPRAVIQAPAATLPASSSVVAPKTAQLTRSAPRLQPHSSVKNPKINAAMKPVRAVKTAEGKVQLQTRDGTAASLQDVVESLANRTIDRSRLQQAGLTPKTIDLLQRQAEALRANQKVLSRASTVATGATAMVAQPTQASGNAKPPSGHTQNLQSSLKTPSSSRKPSSPQTQPPRSQPEPEPQLQRKQPQSNAGKSLDFAEPPPSRNPQLAGWPPEVAPQARSTAAAPKRGSTSETAKPAGKSSTHAPASTMPAGASAIRAVEVKPGGPIRFVNAGSQQPATLAQVVGEVAKGNISQDQLRRAAIGEQQIRWILQASYPERVAGTDARKSSAADLAELERRATAPESIFRQNQANKAMHEAGITTASTYWPEYSRADDDGSPRRIQRLTRDELYDLVLKFFPSFRHSMAGEDKKLDALRAITLLKDFGNTKNVFQCDTSDLEERIGPLRPGSLREKLCNNLNTILNAYHIDDNSDLNHVEIKLFSDAWDYFKKHNKKIAEAVDNNLVGSRYSSIDAVRAAVWFPDQDILSHSIAMGQHPIERFNLAQLSDELDTAVRGRLTSDRDFYKIGHDFIYPIEIARQTAQKKNFDFKARNDAFFESADRFLQMNRHHVEEVNRIKGGLIDLWRGKDTFIGPKYQFADLIVMTGKEASAVRFVDLENALDRIKEQQPGGAPGFLKKLGLKKPSPVVQPLALSPQNLQRKSVIDYRYPEASMTDRTQYQSLTAEERRSALNELSQRELELTYKLGKAHLEENNKWLEDQISDVELEIQGVEIEIKTIQRNIDPEKGFGAKDTNKLLVPLHRNLLNLKLHQNLYKTAVNKNKELEKLSTPELVSLFRSNGFSKIMNNESNSAVEQAADLSQGVVSGRRLDFLTNLMLQEPRPLYGRHSDMEIIVRDLRMRSLGQARDHKSNIPLNVQANVIELVDTYRDIAAVKQLLKDPDLPPPLNGP